MNIKLSIEGDAEGYMTFECPYCESEFKLMIDEVQDEEFYYNELYCTYCGLVGDSDTFYTKEILEAVEKLVTNLMNDKLNKGFSNMAKKINKNKNIKMKWKPLKTDGLDNLKTIDTNEVEFLCENCGKHHKVLYCAGKSKVFCAYCGVDL